MASAQLRLKSSPGFVAAARRQATNWLKSLYEDAVRAAAKPAHTILGLEYKLSFEQPVCF